MAKFDPFLSLDCAPRPPPWRNPRKGRDQILPSGNPVTKGGCDEEGRVLSGAEGLRKRLLESAGFRVVELDYGELSVPGQRLRDRLRALCL